MSTIMSIKIEEYILNLIAGRPIICNLYNAIANAYKICDKGGNFVYTFILDGYGKKRYNGSELIKFDKLSQCKSIYNILINENLSGIDKMIIILLKAKDEIWNLYMTYYRAENAISNGKILYYTFINPYGDFLLLDKDKIRLNEEQIINLFNESKNILFNPNLIIN
jgi:hypothetical protein